MTTLQEEKDQQTADSSRRDSKSLWPICVAIVSIVAIVFAFLAFNKTVNTGTKIGTDVLAWTTKVGKRLSNLFQTKVNVNNGSFTLEQKNIAELAVVQRNIVCVTKYEASFMGSSAVAVIRGVYQVKAGYDLNKGASIKFDEAGKVIFAKLPEPQVLSITPEKQEVFYLSKGLLKDIEAKDFEEAYRQNLEQAKREAKDHGLLIEARERFAQRLTDVLADDAKVEIEKPDLASKM